MLEKFFKNSRYLVFIIVITGFISSILLYLLSINVIVNLVWDFVNGIPDSAKAGQYLAVTLLKVLDILLIALVFQIISIAHYQFFISKEPDINSRFLKVLHIADFHDLKVILLQVATLILTVMFLEQAVETGASLETLYFAISVAVAIYTVVQLIKSMQDK